MKQQYPKCSDYFIIKVYYYGDPKLEKKDEDAYWKQHRERAKIFNDFNWSLIELITGKLKDELYLTYMFDARECVLDEIEENTGIHVARNHETWCNIFIPKKYTFLYNWILTNVNLPYKVVKKINLWSLYRYSDKKALQWRREQALIQAEEFKTKHSIIKS